MPSNTTANRVIGYYPSWGSSKFSPTQAQLLTHVIYAFADMTADGQLSFDSTGVQRLLQLKQVANSYPQLKIMFSFGGASNSQYLSSIAADSSKLTHLVLSTINIIDTYDLDGVDVDWEQPTSAADKSNYVQMMKKFRDALDQRQVKTVVNE